MREWSYRRWPDDSGIPELERTRQLMYAADIRRWIDAFREVHDALVAMRFLRRRRYTSFDWQEHAEVKAALSARLGGNHTVERKLGDVSRWELLLHCAGTGRAWQAWVGGRLLKLDRFTMADRGQYEAMKAMAGLIAKLDKLDAVT